MEQFFYENLLLWDMCLEATTQVQKGIQCTLRKTECVKEAHSHLLGVLNQEVILQKDVLLKLQGWEAER